VKASVHWKPTFVTGVAETPLGKVEDQSELSMVAIAATEALDEAGLSLRDVDGLFVNFMGEEGTVQVGEYLGISPRYSDSTDFGGAAFEAFVHHAVAAISAGMCEVALVTHASRQRSRKSRGRRVTPADSLSGQFEIPHGLPFPLGRYALVAARHMYQYGTTPEQLAEVAVAARKWAQLNPKAWSRDSLSVSDVLASEMICDPLHKLDCCLVTDGGGALVITSAGPARSGTKMPIRILGAATSQSYWNISQEKDITVSAGARSGREAFEIAGIKPADVDVLEPYDSFTITVAMALEDLGFCDKGEGGAFVEGGRLAPGGSLPAMTSGGGLSYCHPGGLGLLLLVEAVRQLRGEAGHRQVLDAEIAVAHGVGGLFSTAGTVVLGRD
jgi:acetyl-CoA acetyltransferase